MSSSFAKSSYGKPGGASRLKKIFRTAVLGIVLASGWADYQYYTPESTKDSVGAWVEQKTGSELLGKAFGHKTPVVTQGAEGGVSAPKAPGQ